MLVSSGVYKIKVTTGGQSYSAAPVVTISGGGGTGAAAVAQMNGTKVDAIVITSAGSGYTSGPTVSLANASGDTTGQSAAATASVLSLTTPAHFFQGRFGDMYGIDGKSRGFRWDGVTPTLEPLGISKPLSAPTVAMSTNAGQGYVRSITILAGGAGYFEPPTVTFSGGGLTDGDPNHATARAKIMNARVIGMTVDARGGSYSSIPTVSFSGGVAAGATLSVGVSGKVTGFDIASRGSGYTSAGSQSVTATVSGGGLTGCQVKVDVDDADGGVRGITILASGTGATTTPTISFGAGKGSGATASPNMEYAVKSVTASSTNAGTNFVAPPAISFRPDGGGAVAIAAVSAGKISSVEITNGGAYSAPPTAVVDPTTARALATIDSPMRGVYKCALRYIDDTTEENQGPIPSSISDFLEITARPDTAQFSWSWSNDGMESRADKIELWRTTSDQAFVLYRVTTISKVAGVMPTTYNDTLTDDQLLDPEREDFGVMPIVMPSGQLNARRFNPPPTYCAHAVMFQDRAWYSVDTRGEKPNSLWHSEIDEPESVPEEYEIVLQESIGEPDAIVALIPLGSTLLIAQSRHIYKMSYVAQPLIDASIRLADSRGILNARCYAVYGGVAYIADYDGIYAFDGSQREDISVPVDDYWRDGVIDFSKKDACYVQAIPAEKTIRFFYCRSGDGAQPTRALCYCVATKAWWEETYAQAMPCATVVTKAGKPVPLNGSASGALMYSSTASIDSGVTAIPFQFRTGAYPLTDEASRKLGLLYKPTAETAPLELRLHYNGSEAHRPNVVFASRGDGFVQNTDGALLDMKSMRSALGASPGYAQAQYAGRFDDNSSGGDRHMAVAITGTRATTETIRLYGLTVAGVTA
jgi:hypothetical protein